MSKQCALQCSPHTSIAFLPPSVRHPSSSKKEDVPHTGHGPWIVTLVRAVKEKGVKYALGKWGADYVNSQEKKKKKKKRKNKKSVLSAEAQVHQKEPFICKKSRHSFLISATFELKDREF